MNDHFFILLTRYVGWVALCSLLGYVIFANTLPFGAEVEYHLHDGGVSALGPQVRVETSEEGGMTVTKQVDDLVYFSTSYPFSFATATVQVTFANPNTEQTIEIGFKDREEWHYQTQVLDTPLFRSDVWKVSKGTPYLYQRNPLWKSTETFLAYVSPNVPIGTLDYSVSGNIGALPDYTPGTATTSINTPLRGKHTMYLYLENEPFILRVSKQDLNWYEDPDVLEVRIYKEDDLVFTAVIDDDGDEDASKYAGSVQNVVVQNPGPGLPEAGVYKVVFDISGDALIQGIETNLHKIVFEGQIFPVENSVVHPSIVKETATTTLYTNSTRLSFVTYHGAGLQDIFMNSTSTPLVTTHQPMFLENTPELSPMMLPKSDVLVSGAGFFAFTENQFFLPTRYTTVEITKASDLEMVEYVISPYNAPVANGVEYRTASRVFDVTTAVPRDGKLSWIIRVPGLKEAGGEIRIKDISVHYSRAGWWKW